MITMIRPLSTCEIASNGMRIMALSLLVSTRVVLATITASDPVDQIYQTSPFPILNQRDLSTKCVDVDGWKTHDTGGLWSGKTCEDIAERADFWCDYLVQYPSKTTQLTSRDACCVCDGGSNIDLGPNSPSDVPSASPTECVDDAEFLWDLQAGHGCSSVTEGFCDTLKDLWHNGKNVVGACCICGGGSHVPLPPSDIPSSPPTLIPTEAISESPSESPSVALSLSPTADHSISPTTTDFELCEDVLGWHTVDPKGFWSGKTCGDISELPQFWCKYLSNFTNSGLSATQACCSCGGGNKQIDIRSKQPSESPSSSPTQCIDQPDWFWDESAKYGCDKLSPSFCGVLNQIWFQGKNAELACCTCGGGYHIPFAPSDIPSAEPSLSQKPSASESPCTKPSTKPSVDPSSKPSIPPTMIPSLSPTSKPSHEPSVDPSVKPTTKPSSQPSSKPSIQPTSKPSLKPTVFPSIVPSLRPTLQCFDFPNNWYDAEGPKFDCVWYADKKNCYHYGSLYENFEKTANEACCVCGGGVTNAHPTTIPSEIPSTSMQPSMASSSTPSERISFEPTSAPSTTSSDTPSGSISSNPSTISSATPTKSDSSVVSLHREDKLGVGGLHTCSIFSDDSVKCWGHNDYAQVGDFSDFGTHWYPTPIDLGAPGRKPLSIESTLHYTCVILDDRSVTCWGDNSYGQLGPPIAKRRSPSLVSNLGPVSAIAVGGHHTCAILEDGSLKCWGRNFYGQLGNSLNFNANPNPTLVDLGAGRKAVAVSLGEYHSCAILDDGSLKCWGLNNFGQKGDGKRDNRSPVPTTVDFGGQSVVAISLGKENSCAILDDESVKCWGRGRSDTAQTTPLNINLGNGRKPKYISLGHHNKYVILDDDSLVCWGTNVHGECGVGPTVTYVDNPSSVDVGAGKKVVAVDGGAHHACAILDDNSLKCWGRYNEGQLGDGIQSNHYTPTFILSLTV